MRRKKNTKIYLFASLGSCLAMSPPTNTASKYTHRFCTRSQRSKISLVFPRSVTHCWICLRKGGLYLIHNKSYFYLITLLILCMSPVNNNLCDKMILKFSHLSAPSFSKLFHHQSSKRYVTGKDGKVMILRVIECEDVHLNCHGKIFFMPCHI